MIKIYYVDDEPELCEVFQELFSSPKVEVLTFTSPASALEKIAEVAPDLLFTDYRMPGMTGVDLAKKCPKGFKIFVISGENNLDLDFPFDAILTKPIKSKLIREIILNFESSQN